MKTHACVLKIHVSGKKIESMKCESTLLIIDWYAKALLAQHASVLRRIQYKVQIPTLFSSKYIGKRRRESTDKLVGYQVY